MDGLEQCQVHIFQQWLSWDVCSPLVCALFNYKLPILCEHHSPTWALEMCFLESFLLIHLFQCLFSVSLLMYMCYYANKLKAINHLSTCISLYFEPSYSYIHLSTFESLSLIMFLSCSCHQPWPAHTLDWFSQPESYLQAQFAYWVSTALQLSRWGSHGLVATACLRSMLSDRNSCSYAQAIEMDTLLAIAEYCGTLPFLHTSHLVSSLHAYTASYLGLPVFFNACKKNPGWFGDVIITHLHHFYKIDQAFPVFLVCLKTHEGLGMISNLHSHSLSLLLASFPDSPPPIHFMHTIHIFACLNVGGGEPGWLWSCADTDDSFSVHRIAMTHHAMDTACVISVCTAMFKHA